MYAQNWDGRLPPADRWMDELQPFIPREDVLQCPALKEKKPKAYGYAMNGDLSLASVNDVAEPGNAPLVFDSVLLVLNAYSGYYGLPDTPRHSNRNNVAYADGHAKGLARTPEGESR